METNTTIINVLTKDFSIANQMLENSNFDNITSSLNSLALSFKHSAKYIEDMKAKVTDDIANTIFIPYIKPSQFFNALKDLSEDIIVVSGIDTDSAEFASWKNNAWIMYEKIVVGESHREMVVNYTDIYVDMFKGANPRNPLCKQSQERITVDPDDRYAKFVEMANQRFTMKEIAVAFNVSIPGIYFIRAGYKERLLADNDVNKKVPAMKFNGKRKL
jgi:hypothetical protein